MHLHSGGGVTKPFEEMSLGPGPVWRGNCDGRFLVPTGAGFSKSRGFSRQGPASSAASSIGSDGDIMQSVREECQKELQRYFNVAFGTSSADVGGDGRSIAEWWTRRRTEEPKLPNLVEVFKNVYGKTMSSAVLENDFKTTSKMMPTDRNLLKDAFYAAQCANKCNWDVVRTIPKDEVPKYDSISKVAKDMPDPTFGVDIYAEADADKTEAANILTSFLRHPMIDCDPDQMRDDEEEREEGELVME